MTTVLAVIGIIIGILFITGIVILISDLSYYRKKEKEKLKIQIRKGDRTSGC